LSIELKAEDEKYVALFKKTNVPSQLRSNNGGFESGSSPQVGYRIDRHGNIRLPIIGEINVLGYSTKEVRLKLEGSNKKRIVDYLNESVKVLERDKKSAKIAYAENTKKYIDNLFEKESDSLKILEKELSRYRSKNNIFNLSAQVTRILEEITLLDQQKRAITNNIEELDSLNNYIITHNKFNNIPVPAIIQIADGKIPQEVGELISKTTVREKLRNVVTDNHPDIIRLDNEIRTTKKIIVENIRNLRNTFSNDLEKINKRLSVTLDKQKALPKKRTRIDSLRKKL